MAASSATASVAAADFDHFVRQRLQLVSAHMKPANRINPKQRTHSWVDAEQTYTRHGLGNRSSHIAFLVDTRRRQKKAAGGSGSGSKQTDMSLPELPISW